MPHPQIIDATDTSVDLEQTALIQVEDRRTELQAKLRRLENYRWDCQQRNMRHIAAGVTRNIEEVEREIAALNGSTTPPGSENPVG